MEVKQFIDQALGHYSYAIFSKQDLVLIDPGRDPKPYLDFAKERNLNLLAVIETHPHADFISCHGELQQTGIQIYCSKITNALYPHVPFDEGDSIAVGDITLKALNTPGHSPDSICVVVENKQGTPEVVFTGDTLFVGNVGRPDLRENTANATATKQELAKAMFYSLRQKLMPLPNETIVYPTHGAGSLCGKSMSKEHSSTIGQEKEINFALQQQTEAQFIKSLLEDQPLIPAYFPFAVELNKKGAAPLAKSLKDISILNSINDLPTGIKCIDCRPLEIFQKGHLRGSINIPNGLKFETWLGILIEPGEPFYLIAESNEILKEVFYKTAKIGYEHFIRGGLAQSGFEDSTSPQLDTAYFSDHQSDYTILDVRNRSEVKEQAIFQKSLNIPLPELQARLEEIPGNKPVVVHCASGYRSGIASSILAPSFENTVYNLGENINAFI